MRLAIEQKVTHCNKWKSDRFLHDLKRMSYVFHECFKEKSKTIKLGGGSSIVVTKANGQLELSSNWASRKILKGFLTKKVGKKILRNISVACLKVNIQKNSQQVDFLGI